MGTFFTGVLISRAHLLKIDIYSLFDCLSMHEPLSLAFAIFPPLLLILFYAVLRCSTRREANEDRCTPDVPRLSAYQLPYDTGYTYKLRASTKPLNAVDVVDG